MTRSLVLASTSTFRKQLLEKLGLPFSCINPEVDESAKPNETAIALVERLAIEKAQAGAQSYQAENPQNALVIGSDQVAVIDGAIIGKPYNEENAIKQLTAASGKVISFFTGLALYDTKSKKLTSDVEVFKVHFRQLSESQIKYYVKTEMPLYCAGSFKSEGLGISLFDRLEGRDPNTLIGLPLIRLIDMLSNHGVDVLSESDC